MASSPSPWREFEERSPALAAVAVGALATLALVIADAFVRDAAQPPRGDELIYERMADDPFGEHTFPFAYRLGVPLLVHVLPFGHEASFSLIAWLAGGGSAAILYVLLRRYEVRPWIAVALGLALVLAPAMLLVSLRQGRNPDAVAVLAMFAGTLCVVDRRPRALAVILLLGALVRETTLFLIPFAYAMWARRAVDREALRTVALAAAPALVAYAVVRWTVPTRRVPPPYQFTVIAVSKGVVVATCRGLGSRSPLTRGRPLPAYGGGGSNRLASGCNLLTRVSRLRCRRQNRATACVPYPESPTNTNARSGNRISTNRRSRHISCAGVRCGRPRLRLSASERYRSTRTGKAHGRVANGNFTSTARITHRCPYRQVA
jgi:hypothetical protein